MKLSSISVILYFLILFPACERDEPLFVENTGIPLLSQVIFDSVLFYEYTYNSTGLLSEEKSKYHYTKHHYNNKNQLTSTDLYWDDALLSSCSYMLDSAMLRKEWVNPENTDRSGYKTFEYNDKGQLLKMTICYLPNETKTFSTFLYDQDERITRQTFFNGDNVSGFIEYLYDDRGNLGTTYKYIVSGTEATELSTTTQYEYDNKWNPYRSFRRLLLPGINTNQNNIIKETYTIHFEVDPFIDPVQIKEISYEYNDKGYPIRKNRNTVYVYK